MPNTALHYMHRDAANYKRWGCVVFSGAITPEQEQRLRANLGPGDTFLPEQVGLANLLEEWASAYDDDGPWHEIESIEVTEARPNDHRTVAEFVDDFATVEWDDAAAVQATEAWKASVPHGC